MVGTKIAKVQCKQCSGYHRYKSPHGAPPEAKLPSNKRPPKEPKGPKAPVERFEKPAVAADLSKPSRTYRASEKFDVGDRVDHPTFGQGIVELSEPGKVTVFFATGRRVLVQSKEGAAGGDKLSRPKPFDHSNPPAGGKSVADLQKP
ncbi:MAG: hypothetical protein KF773_00270 [Deltaproteobacteria bacterium]|nr:hypothetical protein [Deltaproteobacteria bacterium]